MDIREIIIRQPPLFGDEVLYRLYRDAKGGDTLFNILLAASYGKMLGKREERARRKAKSEGTRMSAVKG